MSLMQSWVGSANSATCPYPLNNLPCGVFSVGATDAEPHCGMAIGDFVLDVTALEAEGLLVLEGGPLLDVPFWNAVMEAGPQVWASLRWQVAGLLQEGSTKRWLVEDHLVPLAKVALHLPFLVSEYTGFHGSRHHMTNLGMIGGGGPTGLAPNWLHMPLGSSGRASTVVVSGTGVRRPWGQVKGSVPSFQPSRQFDIGVQIGAVVGLASDGPVTVAEADAMIFGYVLLNDWTARDIQAWEHPSGAFPARATATTLSPWIVMKAALEPFRVATPPREVPVLAYLLEPEPMLYDIAVEVALQPDGGAETVISRTNYAEMSWSAAQLLAQHTSGGCAMNSGDLLGSGTVSGPDKTSRGSLLEMTWGGSEPIKMAGATRSFIEDNDTLILRGAAKGDGYTVGFGACEGKVLPALTDPYAR